MVKERLNESNFANSEVKFGINDENKSVIYKFSFAINHFVSFILKFLLMKFYKCEA